MTSGWMIHTLPVVRIGRTNWPISQNTSRYGYRLTISDNTRFKPRLEKGCHGSIPCFREIHWLGGMRLSRTHCDDKPTVRVLYCTDSWDPRENTSNAVRWRPGLNLQLRWHRGADFCLDMEWRNGIGDGSDTIMDCGRYPCWNMGYVTGSDICQGMESPLCSCWD